MRRKKPVKKRAPRRSSIFEHPDYEGLVHGFCLELRKLQRALENQDREIAALHARILAAQEALKKP